jgi:hypothetical protein
MAVVLSRFRHLVEAGDIAAATRLFAEKVARVPQSIIAALAAAGTTPTDAAQEATAAAEAAGCFARPPGDDRGHTGCPSLGEHRCACSAHARRRHVGADAGHHGRARPRSPEGDSRGLAGTVALCDTHTAPELFAETVRRFLHERE